MNGRSFSAPAASSVWRISPGGLYFYKIAMAKPRVLLDSCTSRKSWSRICVCRWLRNTINYGV